MGGRIFFSEYKPFEATTTLSRLCIGVILCSVGFPNMSCLSALENRLPVGIGEEDGLSMCMQSTHFV